MEGYSNIVMLIILGLGLIFLTNKKRRILGIVLILISMTFLYLIPTVSFWKYKKASVGIYSDKKGTEITIYNNGKYVVRFKGKTISEGKVEYNNHDSYYFALDGYSELISTSVDEIKKFDNGEIQFYKIK